MCILAVQSNILKKRYYDFFFICCPWVQNLVFYPKISARLSKLRYTGPMGSFEENMLCCWRNWFSQTVFDIEWKNCAWMAKTFRQSCENCVFSVYRIILRRNIYSESVFVFFAFFVSRERFEEKFLFSEKNNFLMFCDSERKNFVLNQENFFCRIAKTTIEVSIGTFWRILSEKFLFIFSFFGMHSRCQWVFCRKFPWKFLFHCRSLSKKPGLFV